MDIDEEIKVAQAEVDRLKVAKALCEQIAEDEWVDKLRSNISWPIEYTYYVHTQKGAITEELYEEFPMDIFSEETQEELHYLGYEEPVTIRIHKDGRIETIRYNGRELKDK